jgi:hypothetical protein
MMREDFGTFYDLLFPFFVFVLDLFLLDESAVRLSPLRFTALYLVT